MRAWIGLGSNQGDRRAHLELAAKNILSLLPLRPLLPLRTSLDSAHGASHVRVAPIVETPALVPEGAAEDWNLSFLNSAIEIEWQSTPRDLLSHLKKIEIQMGRVAAPRWAPRLIDLDILTFGDLQINESDFKIPHSEIENRQFVLCPLKYNAPQLYLPGCHESILSLSRKKTNPAPLWMGILNLTPDSFSDGGVMNDFSHFQETVRDFDNENVQILDIGAESTRPGAISVTPQEEWARLAPAFEYLQHLFKGRIFKPLISVDTYHPETAMRALSLGADIINDVSGLNSPEMLNVLKSSKCHYVLMHSLSIPADPKLNINAPCPVREIKEWASQKIDLLQKNGIALDRIIFDPGIGFGKSAQQSRTLLKRIQEFNDLNVRLLVGHSRKSFLTLWGNRPAQDREIETLGVSMKLANQGVDILRVHRPDLHQRLLRAYRET